MCCDDCSPTISGCVVSNNTADQYGGGVFSYYASPTIQSCTVATNSVTGLGAGMCLWGGSPKVAGNAICGNTLEYGAGGGIYITTNDGAEIAGNVISGNEAETGGGIDVVGEASLLIASNVIEGNSSKIGWASGGGIFVAPNSSPTILGNTISGNSAGVGGGIFCWESNPLVSGNLIRGNSAVCAGGIMCWYEAPIIQDNTLTDNWATENAGAIDCYRSSSQLTNNLIFGNRAPYAAGIDLSGSSDEVLNCTIAHNTASAYAGGLLCATDSSVAVVNCILWGNSPDQMCATYGTISVSYSDVQGGWSGIGNIDEDPLFVPLSDAPYYLAHLGPQAGDSPCIDRGDESASAYGLDLYTTCTDGSPDGGVVDMGYHYPEGYGGNEPTYVELVSFEATADGSAILVTWETGAEVDNAGFALFREVAGTHDYRQITDLISARGTATSGASYSFSDRGVERGVRYNYWLVDIETDGEWAPHGPATAAIPLKAGVVDHQTSVTSHGRGAEVRPLVTCPSRGIF